MLKMLMRLGRLSRLSLTSIPSLPCLLGFLLSPSCKVSKRFICFSHAVYIITFFHGTTGSFENIQKLCRKFFCHISFSCSCCCDDPSECERILTIANDWHWYLIICTTNTSRSYFDLWFCCVDYLFKNLYRIFILFCFDECECIVHDCLCDRFFPAFHQKIDESSNQLVSIYWVRHGDTLWCCFSSRHSRMLIMLMKLRRLRRL